MKLLLSAAIAAALGTAVSAHGARIFLSNTATTQAGTPTLTNPTFEITEGQTFQLGVWVQTTDPGSVLNAIGLNLDQTGTGRVRAPDAGTFFQQPNPLIVHPDALDDERFPRRWNTSGQGVRNPSDLRVFEASVAVAIPVFGSTGLNGAYNSDLSGSEATATYSTVALLGISTPTYKPTIQSHFLGTITLRADTPGTVDLFLGNGSDLRALGGGNIQPTYLTNFPNTTTMSFPTDAQGNQLIGFGFGDDLIRTLPALVSASPDATIIVNPIPEPTSLAALALGGLLLVRRRRA